MLILIMGGDDMMILTTIMKMVGGYDKGTRCLATIFCDLMIRCV